jgi:hypothetical protein
MPKFDEHATAIATAAAPEVGLPIVEILTIVTTLLPLFAKCFGGSPASAKEELLNNYDPVRDRFDSSIVKRARSQTRRAARKQGHMRLSKPELDAITVATFRRGLEQDENEVADVVVMAAAMPE